MKKLAKRKLPEYSKGEELANMITHLVGGCFAFACLLVCTGYAAWHKNIAGVVSGIIYGISMITVYVISSIYHGLSPDSALRSKKIFQVIDHCDIYGLIVGTFAPIALTGMRQSSPVVAWVSFAVVAVTSTLGLVFTAIDFKKFRVISYSAYFVSGWSVLLTVKTMLATYSKEFVILIIAGGAVYTLGMIFFWLETKKKKYCHSVFHIFILAGSIIHFVAIFKYCICCSF